GRAELLPIPELLDDAEDVVPPARVEARGVVPEFVQDLLHLEGRRNRLDEGGGLHGADGNPEGLLREPEHLVPEASLQMALHLRQVKVRAGPASPKLLRVVEEVEPEVHQAPRDRYAVDDHVLLRQVPTTGPNQKGRGLPVQTVFLSFGTRELQGPPHRVEQVQLALDDVPPRGRVRVLEIGHEHLGTRVQGIDHHLPIGRPGDLDPSVLQARGARADLPRRLTYGVGPRNDPSRFGFDPYHPFGQLGCHMHPWLKDCFWPRQRPSRRTGECRLNLLRRQGPWGEHGTDGAKTYCLRGTWSRDGGGTGGTDDDDARDVRDPLSRATAGLDLAAPWPRDRRLPARRTASPSMRRQCVGTRQLSGTPGLG